MLRAIGPTVLYVGEGERARVVKLVAPGPRSAARPSCSPRRSCSARPPASSAQTLLEAIGASVVGSPFVAYKTEPLLRDDYSATFTTAMMLKDVDLVLDLAARAGVELPFAAHSCAALLEATAEGGHADEDFMALYARAPAGRSANRDTETGDRT